jgi:hypothetical protein
MNVSAFFQLVLTTTILFGQNMPFVRMAAFNLATWGYFKPFGSSPLCLNLCHNALRTKNTRLASDGLARTKALRCIIGGTSRQVGNDDFFDSYPIGQI